MVSNEVLQLPMHQCMQRATSGFSHLSQAQVIPSEPSRALQHVRYLAVLLSSMIVGSHDAM